MLGNLARGDPLCVGQMPLPSPRRDCPDSFYPGNNRGNYLGSSASKTTITNTVFLWVLFISTSAPCFSFTFTVSHFFCTITQGLGGSGFSLMRTHRAQLWSPRERICGNFFAATGIGGLALKIISKTVEGVRRLRRQVENTDGDNSNFYQRQYYLIARSKV